MSLQGVPQGVIDAVRKFREGQKTSYSSAQLTPQANKKAQARTNTAVKPAQDFWSGMNSQWDQARANEDPLSPYNLGNTFANNPVTGAEAHAVGSVPLVLGSVIGAVKAAKKILPKADDVERGVVGAVKAVQGLSSGKNITKYLPIPKNGLEKQTMDWVINNSDTLERSYTEAVIKEYGSPNVITADVPKFLIPGFDSHLTADYHEASSGFAKYMFDKKIVENKGQGNNTVLFMAGGTGTGKSGVVRNILPNFTRYPIVYDGNLSGVKSASKKIDTALKNGYRVNIAFVHRDPVKSFAEGVIPRLQIEKRIIPISEHVKRHTGNLEDMQKLKEKYGDKIDIKYIDNTGDKGTARLSTLDYLPKFSYTADELSRTLYEKLKEAVQQGTVTPQQAKGFAGI